MQGVRIRSYMELSIIMTPIRTKTTFLMTTLVLILPLAS